jgi:hypothetical protein
MQQKAEFDVFIEVRFLSDKLCQHTYVLLYVFQLYLFFYYYSEVWEIF